MQRYEKYKESGVEWIGEIPEGWEVKKLARTVEKLTNGYVGPTRNIMRSSGVPYIQGIHIKNNTIRFTPTGNYYVDKEWSDTHKKSILQTNDLLVVQTGTIGDVGIVPEEFEGANSHALLIVRAKKSVLFPKYFLYFLTSPLGYTSLQLIKTGEILFHINGSKLKGIDVIIPPLPEQTTIANYLDYKTSEIDQLIVQKEELLCLYEEEKTTIISQAVTQGINPVIKLKDSGIDWLDEIPEHWDVKKLKHIGKFINGYSFSSGDFVSTGVRVLKISNIQHMRIDWSDASYIDESFYEKLSPFRVYKNDLVFALTRPIISTGIKAALIDSDEKILINQRNSIFRTKIIKTNWVFYMLLSKQFINEFDKRIDKTGQQPNISSNDIGDINVPIPSLDEQSTIVHHIETETTRISAKISKTKKIIALQKEYRTALISEVVTGKIKVTREMAS